ncbi:MAG: peptidylprolyl isomerase [Planctomycetaceae bacterium]|nr:peptidylprolyl isomerase [Planctomycetaceae bacterium]
MNTLRLLGGFVIVGLFAGWSWLSESREFLAESQLTLISRMELQDEPNPPAVDDQYVRDELRYAGLTAEELRVELEKKLSEWRHQYARIGQAVMQFHSQKEEEAPRWAAQFREAKKKGEQARKAAGHVAIHLLEKSTGTPDKDLADLAYNSLDSYFVFKEYRKAYRISKALVASGHQRAFLLPLYGYAAYCVNEYSEARSVFSEAKILGESLTQEQEAAFELSKFMADRMEAEKVALQADESANLPRIEFQTTKGNIVVELFEDQAPNTVNNVVSLVEQGFFKNHQFYEINDSMAVTGSPTNDPTGQAGYWIKSEHDRPDRRPHLRGYLTMLVDLQSELASSQFAFVTRPRPDLDQQLNTVFGRIIEGDVILDNLERAGTDWEKMIQAQDSMIGQPDRILSARVVRKRDRDYVPTTEAR